MENIVTQLRKTRIDEQKMKMEERETIDDILTRIETIWSEPIDDIPTRIETIRSEPISTSYCEKHKPKVKSDLDPPPSDSSDSSSSDSENKKNKRKDKKKRRKHRKYDSSDLSFSDESDDSDSSEDSHYRRRRRKNKKHQKKDPIRLCATLTANCWRQHVNQKWSDSNWMRIHSSVKFFSHLHWLT